MSWRHDFPSVAASEDFVHQHPFMFIGYSLALIVVYIIVLAPLYLRLVGSKSNFSNLLYTGPGGALDHQMGSCRSDRDGGANSGCGSAEPFAASRTSGFEADTGSLRHLSVRSRFLGERALDPVYALEQADADAMQAEVRSLTEDDATTPAAAAIPVPAAASRFAAGGSEAHLSAIGYGHA